MSPLQKTQFTDGLINCRIHPKHTSKSQSRLTYTPMKTCVAGIVLNTKEECIDRRTTQEAARDTRTNSYFSQAKPGNEYTGNSKIIRNHEKSTRTPLKSTIISTKKHELYRLANQHASRSYCMKSISYDIHSQSTLSFTDFYLCIPFEP